MNALKRTCRSLLTLMLAIVASPLAHAAAPQVTSTQPSNGDQGVAPGLKEIVVTFDQDMDTAGFSFTGGGPTFPKVTGKPSWRTARECVLPVQLEPGHAYTLGINSPSHTSFRNIKGESVAPLLLSFQTGAADGAPPPASDSAAVQAESVRQLREIIQNHYSYRDVHTVDWAAAWKQYEPRLLAAKSAREFAIVAGEMLTATKDPHIWLVEGGETIPAFRRAARPNVNLKLVSTLVSGWTQRHPMVATGRLDKDTGYIAIYSWDRSHAPQLLDAAFAALDELRGLPALVVDVRLNSGGSEPMARDFASAFIPERRLYARHVSIDPSSATRFSAPVDRWIEPASGRPAYTGRVAVLMGPVNMSSAEAFLLMMKQAPNCKLVGTRSYGSSGNPQPHTLANGVTVMLPSWKAMLPDGTEFETKGIAPDVEVAAKPEDFSLDDPVLKKALQVLKQ